MANPIFGNSLPPVEDPERVKLLKSRWQSFIHPTMRKELDKKVLDTTKEYFQNALHIADPKEFNRLWQEIAQPIWTPSKELTADRISAMETGFKHIIYNGEGVYHDPQPNDLTGDEKAIDEVIQVLCHGQPLSSAHISSKIYKTVLIDADPQILQIAHKALQKELDFLAANPPQTAEKEIIWRTYLGNVLAIVPFIYPPTGSKLTIPVLTNGHCEQVTYNLEKITLPLTRFASPMNALGMTPENNPNAQPIISFMGTTYPGAEGFLTTVLADTYPGHHVGGFVFDKNKTSINEWFQGKSNVHVVGMSLGGALSLHAVKEHSRQIARVDAYVPPGVDAESWDLALTDNCEIYIYTNAGDNVSEIGRWPTKENVKVYRVLAHQEGVGEGPIESHARVPSGCKRVSMIELDAEEVNKSRKRGFLTFLHKYVGPWLVFIPVFGVALAASLVRSIYSVAKRTFTAITGQ